MPDVTTTPDKMQDLPYLSSLESTETKDYGGGILLSIYGMYYLFIVATVVWGYIRYRQFIETSGHIIIGIFAFLILWLIVRFLTGVYYYRTDGSGITMRGVIFRRHIPWSDIRSARLLKTRAETIVVVLETSRGKVKLLPSGLGMKSSAGDAIVASIWQNLKKIDRADGFVLTESALGFWKPIPDDVPNELDWGKPPTRIARIGGGVGIAIFIAFALLPWFLFDRNITQLMLSVVMSYMVLATLKYFILPELTQQAYKISVRDGYLEAVVLFGKVYIPWAEVRFADLQKVGLVIKSTRPRKEIRVSYKMGDKKSEELILAIIRKLRGVGNPHAVALPSLISYDPEMLNRPVSSSRRQAVMKLAFINTLEEPARRIIRRLWRLQIALVVVGVIFATSSIFLDAFEITTRFIHCAGNGSGVRYLLTIPLMAWSIPLILISFFVGDLLGQFLGYRFSGPYKNEWHKFLHIAPEARWMKVFGVVILLLSIAVILTMPLGIDCYTKVTDKGIAINRFFTLHEKQYVWSDISAISIRGESTGTIKFNDGSSWRCREGNVLITPRTDMQEIMQFIANKSGKQIIYEYQQ